LALAQNELPRRFSPGLESKPVLALAENPFACEEVWLKPELDGTAHPGLKRRGNSFWAKAKDFFYSRTPG